MTRPTSANDHQWHQFQLVPGYGDPAAQTVITLGEHRDFVEQNFESCVLACRATNRYGIVNSSPAGWDEIFVCRHLRWPWPEFWKHFQ
jgi:hypothetical protein